MGKKKDDISFELVRLENIERDQMFKDNVTLDKIKELSVIIYQCIEDGKDDEQICRLLSLSQSQVDMIKQTPEYNQSIHQHDIDAEVTRTVLRSYKMPALEALGKRAAEGNVNAIKELLTRVDTKENTGQDLLSLHYELAKRLGIVTAADEANEKILEARALAEDIIEVEVIEEDDDFQDECPEERRLRLLKKRLGLP